MENKLGITDDKLLTQADERISKQGAAMLFDSGRLNTLPVGKFAGLQEIHSALFGNIYPFAGEIRTVNVYKGGMMFTPVEGIDNAVRFADILPHREFGEIVDKFIHMNTVHPFRYGNGRAMRIWLDVMFADAVGAIVDWRRVDKDKYNRAVEKSALDKRELFALLSTSLTEQIDRDTYLRGIDASFALEGLCAYSVARG
ncbi:MAG: Fic family protein [Roseburia sp.]|nr:Fic family protein [Roseburia sp.]